MGNKAVLRDSYLKQAINLVRECMRIQADPEKRIALKAALRYLKLAGTPEHESRPQLSQPAQTALDKILQSGSIRPGPDALDAVPLKLELQEQLTVSEILLRRELRAKTDWDSLIAIEPLYVICDTCGQPTATGLSGDPGDAKAKYADKQTQCRHCGNVLVWSEAYVWPESLTREIFPELFRE